MVTCSTTTLTKLNDKHGRRMRLCCVKLRGKALALFIPFVAKESGDTALFGSTGSVYQGMTVVRTTELCDRMFLGHNNERVLNGHP